MSASRLIAEFDNGQPIVTKRMTKVYYNGCQNEYHVGLWEAGIRVAGATYYTDDKTDAIDTAKLMTRSPADRGQD